MEKLKQFLNHFLSGKMTPKWPGRSKSRPGVNPDSLGWKKMEKAEFLFTKTSKFDIQSKIVFYLTRAISILKYAILSK